MKISNALFLAGTAIGLPVFFVDFSAIPLAVQIAWASVLRAAQCGHMRMAELRSGVSKRRVSGTLNWPGILDRPSTDARNCRMVRVPFSSSITLLMSSSTNE
jgi:hypothetical protein